MKLNVNDDLYVEDPEVDLIRQNVEMMEGGDYAIIEQEYERYVQACRNDDGTFQLEYRAGSENEHFETTVPAGVDDVEQAFIRYVSGMDDWQQPWSWQKVDFSEIEVSDGPSAHDGYLLEGKEFQKVPVGSENYKVLADHGKCRACEISPGSYHSPGCELEQCPCCNGVLADCDCE